MLPPDGHVHSEWSWDAAGGSMERSCARAVELGLPSIAFTEHADFTRWLIDPEVKAQLWPESQVMIGPDGRFNPPPLDPEGYLECVARCRDQFPGLRILSGLELGEPHWHEAGAKALMARGEFDRVLGSVHTLDLDGSRMVDLLFDRLDPADIVRGYLAEALRLAGSSVPFAVLAHIDYPVRHWPLRAGHFDARAFEDEFRTVLRALARSGRALEINTAVPLPAVIVGWWHDAGGDALSFGSDAHDPAAVANDFPHAAAMAESVGFCPGRDPHDFWRRHRAR